MVTDTQTARPCRDFNGHTCIEVSRKDDRVYYIPLDADDGLQLKILNQELFDSRFTPLKDYPVERAAKLYAGYAATLGASEDAMRELAKLTKVHKQEINMAAKKSASRKTKAKKDPSPKKGSAASVFKELIMEGKLTDDQIFAKVKEKFGLADSKRGYVKWYRNYLKNEGKNPPAPKE